MDAKSSSAGRWMLNTIVLASGGALLTYLTLWLSGLIAGTEGRIITPESGPPLGVMFFIMLFLGGVAYAVLIRLVRGGQACATVLGWIAIYYILMFIGQAFPFSPTAYLIAWLAIGGVGAWLINASPRAQLAGAAALGAAGYVAARPGPQELMRRSDYGRVPAETVVLLTQHVRTANGAAQALPAQAPLPIRNAAVQIVLDHIVRDWWENGNRDGLTPVDVADMSAFVQLAWSQAALGASYPEANAIFCAVLKALLGDWFNSWNANGVDGAPRWQWETAR